MNARHIMRYICNTEDILTTGGGLKAVHTDKMLAPAQLQDSVLAKIWKDFERKFNAQGAFENMNMITLGDCKR